MERARRVLIDHISSAHTLLIAILLDLQGALARADGQDAEGRSLVLVGKHNLGGTEAAEEWVRVVLAALGAGEVPDGVVAIAYKPKASEAIVGAVSGPGQEILIDGPRSSGKTMCAPSIFAILAEWHLRAGYSAPLKVLWLHDSLVNAGAKTAATLEEPLWEHLWALRDDRKQAILSVGGMELVHARFVGCRDESASELLRLATHVVGIEELLPTIAEVGISEKDYAVAVSSMVGRLRTPRHIAISTSNPGSPTSWVYDKWLKDGGRPGCLRFQIPASDRLTAEEMATLRETFAGSPDLQKRLADGEWVMSIAGKPVAENFSTELHVSKDRLHPIPGEPIFLGLDFGLTPAAVIGQPVRGYLYIFAALFCERGGIRQFFEASVRPWLAAHAAWVLRDPLTYLRGGYDPSGEHGEQSDSDRNALATVEELFGGLWYRGPIKWPDRNNCLLTALNRHVWPGQPALQLDPVDCAALITALNGQWCYGTDRHGNVQRDLPKKPNHPYEDLGDALIYLLSEMLGSYAHMEVREIRVETEFDPRNTLGIVGWPF